MFSLNHRMSKALSEQTTLLIYAAIIGIGGGYGAVGFRGLINYFTYLFFGRIQNEIGTYHGVRTLFVPIIGGLIVGLLVHFFAKEAKGHGVPEVMYAVTKKKGSIRPRVVVIKALASAITIGSGGSVGREGPIVQIGAAWGSTLGRFMRIREHHLKTLVACGAASGIAATFNAPIGGALFAFEVILGNFSMANVSAIVISSVLSAEIGRDYFGNTASFPIPHYHVSGILILLLFAVLGIIGGLYGAAYARTLVFFENLWDRIKSLPEWIKPATGGIIIGTLGFFFPQVLGVGYPSVEKALMAHFDLRMLLILMVLKLFITSITIASGGSGGVFAPGLYQGAMLGGAVGLIFQMLFPSMQISEGVFAAVGMSTVFAGSAHAPITAMIMLFEMTGNYQLILPLMLATVIATTVSTRINRESIYTMKLMKRGFDIIRKRTTDRLSSFLVEEAIHPEKLCLQDTMTLEQAYTKFENSDEWFATVRDKEENLLGSVSKAQILEELRCNHGNGLILSILPKKIGHVSSKATLSEASKIMNQLGLNYLLVIDKNYNQIGVIGSSDIIKCYKE
ncbi:chloride channel protein [Neobacillus cucumis]|uniref:Chloride channel protein n=1 Tax=Neobacillus cucumis TaxID=1740721 RepID=A0A2N5HSH3_9BACI|nr:chloride channel protein [Neobacillus cucumis]PLS08472.1 chloride channel protein [Neobacillus cucumis]